MAKQADPALEAIRKKHLAIVGKEAGATLGVKQITAAIKKFQEENPGGGDAVTDPSKEEVSNPATPTAVDNTASLASGNDNVIVGKNGDDSISTSGGAGELKAVANYPVNTGDNSGDKVQIMDNDAFRALAKEVTGLDIDQLKSPKDFATPREYINHLLKLMMLDVKLNSLESIGVIKFMAKFNPYPELNEALAEALAELEQDAKGDEQPEKVTNPKINTAPVTEADLSVEMVWIKHQDGRKKQMSRLTWEKFLSKAPNGWSLVPELPAEIRHLK